VIAFPDPLEEEVHFAIKSNVSLITVKEMIIPLGKKREGMSQGMNHCT